MRSTATRSGSGSCSRISACSCFGQVLEDVGGVVGIEVADAFGDGLRRQLFEDFLADRVVDLGERREVELAAHQLDEARAQLRIERLDQVAGVGLVQVADELPQRGGRRRARSQSRRVRGIRPDRAVLVAQDCRGVGRGPVLLVEHGVHAAPSAMM